MSKPFLIFNIILTTLTIHLTDASAVLMEKADKKPVVITSQTLTADSKNNTAVFEGSVVAKTNDITIYSDKMTVFYNNSESKISKIEASGNVRVLKKERAIFSDEAVYLEDEKKIVFRGNPKAVEGENIITGTEITFFLQDDRAVIEGSKVILQNKQGLK
ncbi:MAG: lipopolysaccharide transport periplasmic protein LptA [Nitrospirae bacterium]|nr:lipopolysaccharide transport periplasmic protein LptA [Nitrospirota bacterium]